VLSGFGFTSQDIHQLIGDTRKVYNLNRIMSEIVDIIRQRNGLEPFEAAA